MGALLRIACVVTIDYEERSRPVWRDRRTLIDTFLGDPVVVASPTVGDYVVDLSVESNGSRKRSEKDVVGPDISDLHYELQVC